MQQCRPHSKRKGKTCVDLVTVDDARHRKGIKYRVYLYVFHQHTTTMSLKKKFLKSGNLCTVTFSLPKESLNGATEVKILGDFNEWNADRGIPMKDKSGIFTGSINLPCNEEYQFRYLIGNGTWENDWAADKYVASPFGVENSVVNVVA